MITQDRVKELFSYSPDTGLFTWRINKPPRGKIGHLAGYNAGHGYIKISVDGKRHYAHRLAFLYMTGTVPTEIDHINQCRHDNRWKNLRAANRASNTANVSGRAGVRCRYGRWYARYGPTHLGVFDTKAEAVAARRTFEIEIAGVDPNAPYDVPQNVIAKRFNHGSFSYKNKTLSEWSRELGIAQPTLHWRIFKKGMSPEEALTK